MDIALLKKAIGLARKLREAEASNENHLRPEERGKARAAILSERTDVLKQLVASVQVDDLLHGHREHQAAAAEQKITHALAVRVVGAPDAHIQAEAFVNWLFENSDGQALLKGLEA